MIAERVLLLEFVNADQLPGRISSTFPLIAGRCTEAGAALRWLRFGLATTHFLVSGSDAVILPAAEEATLLRTVREFRPDLLLCTDVLAPALRRRIRRLAPAVAFVEALSHAYPSAPLPPGLRGDLSAHLGRRGFRPRYDWEAGNESALRRDIDNVYLVLRQSCGHRQAIPSGLHFAGLDDSRVKLHRGCSFCLSGCSRGRHAQAGGATTPVAWLRKQIAGIVRTRGRRLPSAVLLESLPAPGVLQVCLDELRAAGMDKVQLHLGVRTDLAPRLEQILRRHFAARPDSGIRVGVYASGLESFVADELRLFNKGTTPEDNLRALVAYQRLAAEYPDRFSFYGLSMILFTPWTTPEGLDLNLGMCRALGLRRNVVGNLYQSRLRLHPELPLTALAERQGLLAAREADPLLRMNRRKLFSSERAWRFADPRLRPLCRLVLRYDLTEGDLADPLARDIARRLKEADWRGEENALLLDLTRCMIAVLRARRRPLTPRGLLAKAFALWRDRQLPRPRPRRIGPRIVGLAELVERLAEVLTRGGRRVCAVGDATQPELDSVADLLARRGIHGALVGRGGDPTAPGTLLLSGDRQVLARRAELELSLWTETGDAQRAAYLEAGLLDGLPDCCARARAARPFTGPGLEGWAIFAGRAEHPGSIPVELNPLFSPEVGFAPCSVRCRRALASHRAAFDALGERPLPEHAYLESLDGWECRAWRVRGAGEDWLEVEDARGSARGAQARRIRVATGQILVLDPSGPAEVLTTTHGIWWPERCFQPAGWRAMSPAVAWAWEHRGAMPDRTAREPPCEPSPEPEPAPVPPRLGGLILSVFDRGATGARYTFRVAAATPGRAFLLRAGPWILWYSHAELGERDRGVAGAMARVMLRHQGQALTAACLEPWRRSFAEELGGTGLAPELRWSLEWRDDCDAEPEALPA